MASVLLELALFRGADAAAVLVAAYVGGWVYAAAGADLVGSLPILGPDIARVAHREWRARSFSPGDPA